MAQDPNPVEIKVTSSADVAGLDKAKEAIVETTEAAKQQGLTEEQIAAKRAEADKKFLEWQEANREANEAAHRQWLADHERRTKGIKEETQATQELTEAEAERAARKAAYEARLAEKRANGTNVAAPSTGEGPNPFTDGSQLQARPAVPTREIKDQTAAIQEQAGALKDLTDAEAGVIRSTGKLNDEANKPDGFKQLFDQERLKGIGEEIGKLGKIFGEFANEFAKTERGKEMLSGLSEGTRVFGSTALGTVSAVAQGFAQGGPVGAAIAGVGALFQKVADEWVDAQKRIEASNAELAQFEKEHADIQAQRRRDAKEAAVEKAYQRELDVLEDQNEVLRAQKELRDAMADRDREAFDLKQAQDKANGADPSQQRKDKILFERDRQLRDLKEEEDALQRDRFAAEKDVLIAKNKRDGFTGPGFGTKSPEYKAADEAYKKALEELEDKNRDIIARGRAINTRREGVDLRSKREIFEEDQAEKERQEREKQRRDEQAARERERGEKDAEREEERRERERGQFGRDGESAADQAARMAGKNARAAAAFEKLGDGLADNPTLTGMDRLSDGIEKMGKAVGDQNSAEARRWRDLNDKVEKIIAQMKKRGDGK